MKLSKKAKTTIHGYARTAQRCRVVGAEAKRMVDMAYKNGIPVSETYGALQKYLESKSFKNHSEVKVYGNRVYIFKENALITVCPMPPYFYKAVNSIIKNKANRRNTNATEQIN
jgi:hypothetical protein